ncbi:MAG: hypothetical protein COA79_21620 [Planctomycetota bacterium]|nr:MAG: hypothetical protein COA79_21620 [Planctomycetota bacterium]
MRINTLIEMIKNKIDHSELLEEIEKLKFNNFGCHWQLEDIMEKALEMDLRITLETAREIADKIENSFDANHGINWEIIEIHIEEFYLN